MKRTTIFAAWASMELFLLMGAAPSACASPIISAAYTTVLNAEFREGDRRADVVLVEGLYEYSESRTYSWGNSDLWGRGPIGEVYTTVETRPGTVPTIIVEGKATEVDSFWSSGQITYGLRLMKIYGIIYLTKHQKERKM